MLAKIVQHNL
jgi:hypothetical protein